MISTRSNDRLKHLFAPEVDRYVLVVVAEGTTKLQSTRVVVIILVLKAETLSLIVCLSLLLDNGVVRPVCLAMAALRNNRAEALCYYYYYFYYFYDYWPTSSFI